MANTSEYNKKPKEIKDGHLSLADEILSFPKIQGALPSKENLLNLADAALAAFSEAVEKIKQHPAGLGKTERTQLQDALKDVSAKTEILENITLQLGRILDYDNLKKEGATAQNIADYVAQDDKTLAKAKTFTQKNHQIREQMFGYPVSLHYDTAITAYLRKMETKLCIINNCGDSYETSNFLIDAKVDYEQPILNEIYKHLGLNPPEITVTEHIAPDGTKTKTVDYKGPWGYITPGGSESNQWGISNGLRKYPNAVVYYSKAAHYSVPKAVINFRESEPVNTQADSEKIDVDELLCKVKNNWDLYQKPAVIVLTWGTTKTGAIDDVSLISKRLKALNIAHYIHLDAALYGGIAKNQQTAPVLPDLEKAGVDSVCMSLHKYFGSTGINSVVVARQKPHCDYVDYIGITDTTIAGSRGFSPFSTWQRVVETLERKNTGDYIKNVAFFDKLLRENHIEFSREENANIFVINKPADAICKKYQLSTFKKTDNNEKAHIIIFPYHTEQKMRALVWDLAEDNRANAK